ncbi:unnamed protein product [Closterium sp. Naga37s-1]|nr:unnamed protein product [Closterium sp. Naga37s-1]
MDATTVCPIPAIDWRAVPQDEITHLAHQGMVAPDVSADHHIRNENEMRRRRRRHLRRMAREANAELARSVAEWRRQSFRHPDSQAVVVLAAESARSRDWSAEDHRRSFSCGDLGEYGPPDASHGGCSGRIVPNGRENSAGETGVKREGAPPRRSERPSCSPSDASGVPPGASAGASAGAPSAAPSRSSSSAASCKPGHRRGVSVNALPELCPYPPVDWRWVPSPEPAGASHCATAAASCNPDGALCKPGHWRGVSVNALPELCPYPPVDWRWVPSPDPAAASHCAAAAASRCPDPASRCPAAPDSNHAHRVQKPSQGALGNYSDTSAAAACRSLTAGSEASCVLKHSGYGTSNADQAVKTSTGINQSTSSVATAAAAVAAAGGEGFVQPLTSGNCKTGEAGRGAGGQEAGARGAGAVGKKQRSGALHGAKARWLPPVSAALHRCFS